ncbi:hypothetical protein DFH06DRAFT_1387101 [Mycena polygramma]|nr:hypothetical protein DFH06DRAFT_1387101 [Mycena polygramma]
MIQISMQRKQELTKALSSTFPTNTSRVDSKQGLRRCSRRFLVMSLRPDSRSSTSTDATAANAISVLENNATTRPTIPARDSPWGFAVVSYRRLIVLEREDLREGAQWVSSRHQMGSVNQVCVLPRKTRPVARSLKAWQDSPRLATPYETTQCLVAACEDLQGLSGWLATTHKLTQGPKPTQTVASQLTFFRHIISGMHATAIGGKEECFVIRRITKKT